MLANKIKENKSTVKIAMGSLLLTRLKLQGTVPDMLISVNPGLKFCSVFCILHSYALLRVTFCVITTVSCSKGSTVYCNLELHVGPRFIICCTVQPGFNKPLYNKVLSIAMIFFTPVIVKYMEKTLDITKPCYSAQILPVP